MERGLETFRKRLRLVMQKHRTHIKRSKKRVYAGAKLSNQGRRTDVGYPKFYVPT